MKTLEEVIKQKCKFQGHSKRSYKLYEIVPYSRPNSNITLFRSNPNVKVKDVCTLLEEMTPLFVYIISCLKYYNYQQFSELNMSLVFYNSDSVLNLIGPFSYDNSLNSNTIKVINENINEIRSRGHYTVFSDYFSVELVIIVDEDYDDEDDDNEEDEPLIINEVKTYKSDECVICLENKNNVLFCNCGHICVCEKCIEIKRLTKCPVCKTENTILRIIE